MTNGLRIFVACMVLSATVAFAGNLAAQEPAEKSGLFDSVGVNTPSSPSDLVTGPATVRELRIARGQYQMKQRMARLERNRWAGAQPLRPHWTSPPITTSQYGYRSVYYVPVYFYSR